MNAHQRSFELKSATALPPIIGKSVGSTTTATTAAGSAEATANIAASIHAARGNGGADPTAGSGGAATLSNSAARLPVVQQPIDRSYDDFDWHSDESVVFAEQIATAVYLNERGDLVIRQRAQWPDEDSDPFMVVTASSVPAFLDRVCDVCGVLSFGKHDG